MRRRCVFTTHTPVPAGHDRFSGEQAYRILGAERAGMLERFGCFHDGLLNMTYVALRFSRFVNGVAMQHGKVSRQMFPDTPIDAITNGVHAGTWTAPSVQALFDRHLPRWRQDNVTLRYAIDIPENEIVEAHAASKRALIEDGEGSAPAWRCDRTSSPSALRAAPPPTNAPICCLPTRSGWCAWRRNSGGMQVIYARQGASCGRAGQGENPPRDRAGE